MKLLVIIFSLISVLAFGRFAIDILKYYDHKSKIKKSKTIISSIFLLSLSSFMIAVTLSFSNDFLYNANTVETDYTKVGAYGDLIGGIMNPVISFIGIIAASLAFYMQYKANKQVQEQFEKQMKKENLDYIYNKFNSQIQLILDEINKFNFSHYYPFYSKFKPVRPEITESRFITFRQKELLDEYKEKLKEYENSKRFEKRNFEGVLAINELFLLLNKIDKFEFSEDYFDKSFNNPKVNEVYYVLNHFNLIIHDIQNNFNDNINLKEDLINRLIFLYNTKLSAIANNNFVNLSDENLLKIEMDKLRLYFNSKSILN